MALKITPLTGSIGASVEGVRLGWRLDDATLTTLREAFLEYSMLVFRGQHLEAPAHAEFARHWGEPVVTAMLDQLPDAPGVVQITDVKKETTATEAWHYDATFEKVPPKISILSAVTIPVGGDTLWSNQYLAFERLSPDLRRVLETLRVRFRGIRLGRMMGIPEEERPQAVHPLVRTHPETGRKALYVGHLENSCIEGWTREESDPLMEFLYNQSVTPDNVYRHTWQPGDLVMWDNRCTMHYAVHDYGDQPRALNRITLHGEAPA
ncbi:TauD/TfdA dioxygenase family protein [Streptomyces sp. NPDC048527]|uniref:TauD/TfdA dioxygenase family protein n=1 Tax=Streptomyces sp. NPDC048527 TaxID=3365568 RepID=UPI003724783D